MSGILGILLLLAGSMTENVISSSIQTDPSRTLLLPKRGN